uniref:Uncharacterized protein n=2 Tax=Oryza TaxID=4527 RepID=Q5Z965_ORYSJ|nr:hypothetical protein [Oryza sativa Japonica Group]
MARGVEVSELLSAHHVAMYGVVRVKELQRLLAHLTKNTSSAKPIDLSECFLNLANDVLCRVAFGRRFPRDEGDKLSAVLANAQDLLPGSPSATSSLSSSPSPAPSPDSATASRSASPTSARPATSSWTCTSAATASASPATAKRTSSTSSSVSRQRQVER